MADDKTIERIQQEVVSANKDRLHQATLKEVKNNELQAKIKLGREVQELEMKHKNWLLDQKNTAMFNKIFNVSKKGGNN